MWGYPVLLLLGGVFIRIPPNTKFKTLMLLKISILLILFYVKID